MLLTKQIFKKSVILATLAVVSLPFSIILHGKGYVSYDFMMGMLIVALLIVGYVGYKEYKRKSFSGMFRNSHKHIGTKHAVSIWKRSYEEAYGERILVIKPIYHPLLHRELGDQVAICFVKTVKERFVAFIPLDRGLASITDLDTPMIADFSTRYNRKYVEMFAKQSRTDVISAISEALPIEHRAELFKESVKSSSGDEKKEEEEVKSSKE